MQHLRGGHYYSYPPPRPAGVLAGHGNNSHYSSSNIGPLSPSGLLLSNPYRHVQVAYHWQAVIRKRIIDPKTGEHKYEDWDHVIRSFQHPSALTHPGAATTTTLLDRHLAQDRHIKPTEIRRRINSAKAYRRSVRRVDDLASYIQFIQETKKDD